jgi:NAD(P)-dependent dehydrogenase (short-subunit alcohol dehydrogenase family)
LTGNPTFFQEQRPMPSVLVTGANRGLGLEFVRQYAAGGWRVFACARQPVEAAALREVAAPAGRRVSLHRLEVADHAQIAALAQELKDESIDLLLNNAGVYGPNKMFLGQVDYKTWAEVLAINTMSPLRMAECFVENVARSERKIIASISSTMGSIARNVEGRHYLYRSSKAALNMVMKSLSIDLRARGVIAVALCPGWVQTDMGGANATLTPEQSISGLRRVLANITREDSGKFLSYDGSEIPW